jgi:hypothetical protein
MSLELTVGDTAPTLTGTVSADLTGSSIEVHIRKPDGTAVTRAGTIVSPSGGTWSLALVAGDLSLPGLHRIEVQVTFSGGAIQTFADDTSGAGVTFLVRDQIA